MLQDPLVMSAYPGTAVPTYPVATSTPSARRLANGRFVITDSPFSMDQPARINITPKVRLNGPSATTLRFEVDKNVGSINGVLQADKTMTITISLSADQSTFTATEIYAAFLNATKLVSDNFNRLLVGES